MGTCVSTEAPVAEVSFVQPHRVILPKVKPSHDSPRRSLDTKLFLHDFHSLSDNSGEEDASTAMSAVHGYIHSAMITSRYQCHLVDEERAFNAKLQAATEHARTIAAYKNRHHRRFGGSKSNSSSVALLPQNDELPFFFPAPLPHGNN